MAGNPVKRLMYSLSWRLFRHAAAQFKTKSGLRIPLRQRGDFACVQEIFMDRVYDHFFTRLGDVRSWVDLGCNSGYFSLALYDALGRPPDTSALLIDANPLCVNVSRELIELNQLSNQFSVQQGLIGSLGVPTAFFESKSTTRSSIHQPDSIEKKRLYAPINLSDRIGSRKDLVKIDIEGAEKILIEEQTETLLRFKYGLIEWHAPHYPSASLLQWLRANRLEIMEIVSQNERFHDNPTASPLGMVLWKNPAV